MKCRPVLFYCCLILADFLLSLACKLGHSEAIPVIAKATHVSAETS
jgi:hypothetical protein